MSDTSLKVQTSSDVEQPFLLAEILIDVGSCVIVTRDESGAAFVQVPCYDCERKFSRKIPFDEFVRALDDAFLQVGTGNKL